MKAPVLLIGFNRPDNMCQVFEQIKKAKPEVLYKEGEEEKCQQCRDLAKQVDWQCELHTLFREKNAGCALGVSGAISWAFEHEDRLFILEDDCVPVLSFFTFCDEMLEKYKDDSRVWQICGRSHHANSPFFEKSEYIFTLFSHIWGWATWKRCWNDFDLKISDCQEFLLFGGALNLFPLKWMAKELNEGYKKIYDNIEYVSSHTWDYQWGYIKLKNGALGIVPCKNLIKNIGSASGAHSSGPYIEDIPTEEMPLKIRHPQFVMASRKYDEYHYKRSIRTPFMIRFIRRIKNLIK